MRAAVPNPTVVASQPTLAGFGSHMSLNPASVAGAATRCGVKDEAGAADRRPYLTTPSRPAQRIESTRASESLTPADNSACAAASRRATPPPRARTPAARRPGCPLRSCSRG